MLTTYGRVTQEISTGAAAISLQLMKGDCVRAADYLSHWLA